MIELAVGIAAAVFKNDFSMAMKDTLKESMKNYTEADRLAWDNVQKKVSTLNRERSNANGFVDTKAKWWNRYNFRAKENNEKRNSCGWGHIKRSSRANGRGAIKVISILSALTAVCQFWLSCSRVPYFKSLHSIFQSNLTL